MREAIFFVSKTCSVKEIQDRFSTLFSFLKINFFKIGKPGPGVSGSRVILFSPELLLKEINPGMTDGELTIRESMTVLELENYLYEEFGLSAQILRKSGNLWLDTSRTNAWTLKEQDDHGREISPEQIKNTGIVRETGIRRNLG